MTNSVAFKFRRVGRIEVLCPTCVFQYGVVRFVPITGGFVLVTGGFVLVTGGFVPVTVGTRHKSANFRAERSPGGAHLNVG